MPTFIISYDLATSSPAERDLREAIAKLGPSWHGIRSTVIVHSDFHTVDQVRDLLLPHVADGGKLLVVKSGVQGAWSGLEAREVELLSQLL